MNKKLAKLEYLPNNFKVIVEGDHVICAVSGKVIRRIKLLECRFTRAILLL